MKFKTSAIAMAVAGTVAAPVAMAADGEIYASARVGIVNTDTDSYDTYNKNGKKNGEVDNENQWAVRSLASRFGARGETDLGNGMTGFGRYEWDVDMENGQSITLRHRYVGVKGDWGSVLMGQTYQTFYNFVVGPLDNPWWGSGYSMVAYVGRTGDAVTYAGGADKFQFGATAYLMSDANEDDIDGYELGASFAIGDMTLGAGWKATENAPQGSANNDDDIIGVALSGIQIGDLVTLGISYEQQDKDDGWVLDVLIGNGYVHWEMLSSDAKDADPQTLTLGYTHSLGRNTTMWFEYQITDNDSEKVAVTNDAGDVTGFYENASFNVFRAMLKYDIL